MSSINQPASTAQSSFVTVLAWIFIVLSGFATFIAVLQNIAIHVFFPIDQFPAVFGNARTPQQLPPLAEFLLRHVRWFLAGFLLFSSITLGAAIGLLKRKNWARIIFVGLMSLGIAWSIMSVVLQYTLLSSMVPHVPADAPAEFQSHFERMSTIMMAFSSVMAIVFTTLFGWIIKRLISPTVRREFVSVL